MTKRLLTGILILTAIPVMHQSHAQDAAAVSPEIYNVIFENDDIRVLEVTYEPGERDAPHSHPRYVVLATEGGTIRIHVEGSDPTDVVVEANQPMLLDPVERHWGENIGETTIRIIAVEYKNLQSQ